MPDFSLKQNDQSPSIEYQLQKSDGSARDISGYNEVSFHMKNSPESSSTKVDDDTSGNVSVTDASNGKVKYEWQSGDTDTPGIFYAEWEVELGSGDKETFPNTDHIVIRVHEEIA